MGIYISEWFHPGWLVYGFGCFDRQGLPSQRPFPSVDHLAACAAHVAHRARVLGGTSAKNWLILVLLLAITSVFLGRPLPLPVGM